jgi:hypothetical protein
MKLLGFSLIAFFSISSWIHASRADKASEPFSSSSVWNEEVINAPLKHSFLKADNKEIFRRVIQARLFHQGFWTLSGSSQTPLSVGRSLASLHPTFVTGLVRVPDYGGISNSDVEAFKSVRSAVLTENRECLFDMVVNAGDESFGSVFIEHLKQINAKVRPDALTFLVRPNDKNVNALVLAKGIAYAHSCGQLVGFEGPLSLIPEGVDFIVIRAWDFKVSKAKLASLRAKYAVPLIVQIPTSFGKSKQLDVLSYFKNTNGVDRAEVISRLAVDQSSFGYRFAYPMIYPIDPDSRSFDATKDPILFVTIRALMVKLN